MPVRKFFLSFLISVSLLTQVVSAHADSGELAYFLSLDRFTYYVHELAAHVAKQGRPELASAIATLTPEEAVKAGYSVQELATLEKVDEMVVRWLKKNKPGLKFNETDVKWNYNFFKNKLADSYRIEPFNYSAKAEKWTQNYPAKLPEEAALPFADDSPITFNAEQYMSNRTTRAVFWEANKNGRKMELHVGSFRDFYDNVHGRGGKILSEIRPTARNYNRIFMVQFPGEAEPCYAISSISGKDRLDHLMRQIKLAKSPLPSVGQAAQSVQVSVHGSVAELHAQEEKKLTALFETLPKADKVIIGQKGAIESAIRTNLKAEAAALYYVEHPESAKKLLTSEQIKVIEKRLDATGANLMAPVKESAATWDKIVDVLKLELPALETFSVENTSHDLSDVVLTTRDGKKLRLRLISNMWGDEVVPVAKALKASGHKNIVYSGTAGALPGGGYKLGDLVVLDKNSGKVAHVGSPYEETEVWLAQVRTKGASAVELETSYLESVFNAADDKLKIFLLISDEVNSKNATLAEATSASREKAQNAMLTQVFAEDQIRAKQPGVILNATSTVKRDLASLYQVNQVAAKLGKTSQADIDALMASEKAFTTEFLETQLLETDRVMSGLAYRARQQGVLPSVGLPTNLLDGTWNPKTDKLVVTLHVASQQAELELKSIVEEFLKSDPNARKALELRVIRGPPPPASVNIGELDQHAFRKIYSDAALRNGGLVASETRSGALKFTQVPLRNPAVNCVSSKAGCTLAFFAPDKTTQELLQRFDGKITGAAQVMDLVVKKLSKSADKWNGINWKISQVDELTDGALAEVVPEFSEGKMVANLKLTKQALDNPFVLAEEYVHMLQIAGAAGDFEYFHPAQWVETVWNAKAGDVESKKLLAELEVYAQEHLTKLVHDNSFRRMFDLPAHISFSEVVEARKKHAEEKLLLVAKEEKAQRLAARRAFEARKASFGKFEKQAEKLNDLVAKGDRKGVRVLLENYLPWEIMKPSERTVWAQWLEAIEKPDPARSRLLFRGMDDDQIMRTKDGKPYTMSKVLVKNQGNYTRRLRSLDASRAKILQNYGKADTDILSLSFLMRAHAVDPYASQFVSLTPNVAIAYSFGYEKKAAIMIDERRLFSNIYSKFSSETELLTPLIIFPDEIVYFDESKTSVSVFISNYEKVTGKKFVRIPDIEIVKVFRAQAKLKQQELFGKDPAPTTECVKGVLKALLL